MPAEIVLSPVARLVRRHDPDRFLAALFAPAERREDLIALYAFNYEVAKTREVVSEPTLGRIRLQWWRDGIEAIYAGGRVRHHEVVEPLAGAIRRCDLTRYHFDRLIDAREFDLRDQPPADLAALELYADDTSGRLVLLALEALGVREGPALEAGRGVGIAYALAGLLRATPFLASAKRLYLPADLVAAAGLRVQQDLFELKPSPALAQAVRPVAEAAAGHLARARAVRRQMPRAALPALLPGVLAGAWLERLRRAGWDALDHRLAAPDAWRSWRLALAASTRRY